MKIHRRITVFTDKYPFIGPLVWILSIQYFVTQFIAATVWPIPYSWAQNVISDLGNTACGTYVDRYVCSPSHVLMNTSFLLLGITMAVGSMLIYTEFRRSRLSFFGFICMALAGLGTVLVGLFPENTISGFHFIGAFLALGVGNLGMVILAFAITQARASFRIYTFLSGILALTAFNLFAAHVYLGLGSGAMERIASYPQTVWLILFGLYMTGTRLRARHVN